MPFLQSLLLSVNRTGYRPQTKSVCPQGGGGCAWQGVCVWWEGMHGGVHGRGACMAGACMAGGCAWGPAMHAWQGACMAGGCMAEGACMVGRCVAGGCMAGPACMAGGACMTVGAYVAGTCVVGGMCGGGACMGGGHVWQGAWHGGWCTMHTPQQILQLWYMVNERAVRILLECILVWYCGHLLLTVQYPWNLYCQIYTLILFRDNLGSVPNPSAGRKMPRPVHVLGKYFTYNCTKIFLIFTQITKVLHMETSLGNSNIYIICVNCFGEHIKIIITYQ